MRQRAFRTQVTKFNIFTSQHHKNACDGMLLTKQAV